MAAPLLSWVPRYVLLILILIIYLFLYVYVNRMMVNYGRRASGSLYSATPRCSPESEQRCASAPCNCVPRPPSSDSELLSTSIWISLQGAPSLRILGQHHQPRERRLPRPARSGRVARGSLALGLARNYLQIGTASGTPRSRPGSILRRLDLDEPVSPGSVSPKRPPAVHRLSTTTTNRASDELVEPLPICQPLGVGVLYFWREPITSPQSAHLAGCVADGAQTGSQRKSSRGQLDVYPAEGPDLGDSPVAASLSSSIAVDVMAVTRNRERMRRQLFSLFIYPLVYIIIWSLPVYLPYSRIRRCHYGRRPAVASHC